MRVKVSLYDDCIASARALLKNPEVEAGAKLIRCHWIKGGVQLMKKSMHIDISMIKDIQVGDFLKVDKDVLWVTPEVWEQLMVMSNLEWTII